MVSLPAAVVVDHFNSPDGGQVATISNGSAGNSNDNLQTGLTVLGGSRDIFLQIQLAYDWSTICSVNVNGITSKDELSIINGPNLDTMCRLTWDANSSGLNTNLSADYEFQVLNVYTSHPVAFTITMQTFGGGTSTQTINTVENYVGNVTFPFSGFAGGVTLADVDSISLRIDGARATEIALDALVTVPEPTSAGLALLGGLGLLIRRRRA